MIKDKTYFCIQITFNNLIKPCLSIQTQMIQFDTVYSHSLFDLFSNDKRDIFNIISLTLVEIIVF